MRLLYLYIALSITQGENDMKKQNIGTILVFLAAVCASINGVLIKLFSWSAMSINALGNLIGVVVIIVYMLAVKHRFVFNKSVLLGGMFVFLTNLLSAYANKLTTVANAIVLQFTMPMFIILAMWIFFKERPKKFDIITSVVILIGIAFFVIDGLAVGNGFGNFLALLSGVTCAGIYMLEKIPRNDSFSAIVIGKMMCFLIGIPALMGESPLTGAAIGGMAVYGIVQGGLQFIFLPLGLRYAPPVAASFLAIAEPLLAPVWVALFYPSEQVTPKAWIGFTIVIAALIVYNVKKAKQDAKTARY